MSALEPGTALEPQTFEVTRADLVAYAAASGDQNPIHQDESVALAVGLPGVIAHGMYTMALAARAVATWTDGAEVLELGCKFTAPVVVPADGAAVVRVGGTVKALDDDRLTLALEVTVPAAADGGEEAKPVKVLGNPRAVVRA